MSVHAHVVPRLHTAMATLRRERDELRQALADADDERAALLALAHELAVALDDEVDARYGLVRELSSSGTALLHARQRGVL